MTDSTPRRLALLGACLSLVIILSAAVLGYRSYERARLNPMTDDAAVDAEIVRISTAVPGRIKTLNVTENDTVRKGDVLLELDPAAYELAVEQARADLEIAQAAASDRARNIEAERANAQIAAEQVARAEANLELATQSLDRLLPMEERGFVSKQQIDDARTLKRGAEVSLREALRQKEAAEALIGDRAGTEALIRARQAALAIAEHELQNTVLRAPHDGRTVGVTASEGDYVLPAQSLFSLIRTNAWFVTASYTETTLPQIAAGACATVFVLADRTRPIRGVVESIGWGVTSKDLINLPVSLPIVPKSLDWVRVQQRFPVRIRLIDPPPQLMRVGASAVATVHPRDADC